MPPALHPDFSSPCRPPPALSSSLATFDCFTFPSHFYREHYGFWLSIFYPQAFFTLRFFATFLPRPGFIKVSPPWSRQFFLEFCRASFWSSKHRPGPSVCLIHSNPQSWYTEESVFKSYLILPWITCGKKFSWSAPYLFRTLFACLMSYGKTIKTL